MPLDINTKMSTHPSPHAKVNPVTQYYSLCDFKILATEESPVCLYKEGSNKREYLPVYGRIHYWQVFTIIKISIIVLWTVFRFIKMLILYSFTQWNIFSDTKYDTLSIFPIESIRILLYHQYNNWEETKFGICPNLSTWASKQDILDRWGRR